MITDDTAREGDHMRTLYLIYGIACHLLFLLVFAWLLLFVANLSPWKGIDGPVQSSVGPSLAIDALLIVIFGLQHSVMARPAFKRWWTRFVPRPIERSTYVLASCVVTVLLIVAWQPVDVVFWRTSGWGALALWGLFLFGWLLVPAVSLMIHHFDLFGTRQVWLHWQGREAEPLAFRTPLLYAHMRHPLYVGWAIAFWAAPTMTLGHMLFAAGMTAYMLIAVQFEERDLISHFGEEYLTYQRRVGMFWPRWRRSRSLEVVAESSNMRT